MYFLFGFFLLGFETCFAPSTVLVSWCAVQNASQEERIGPILKKGTSVIMFDLLHSLLVDQYRITCCGDYLHACIEKAEQEEDATNLNESNAGTNARVEKAAGAGKQTISSLVKGPEAF